MTDILVAVNLAAGALTLVLVIILLVRRTDGKSGADCAARRESEATREYIARALGMTSEHTGASLDRLSRALAEKLGDLERRVEDLTKTNEYRMERMQDSVSKQLEQMRELVSEKLDSTLSQRLNKSFEIINSRLEAVYKGLGEMQGLARGVGDLKKVLSNVKVRGTFGELQLGSLLEQVLTPAQYSTNFGIDPSSGERVDFAIKMPGREGQEIYLPIDAKFPVEEYRRLAEAEETGDGAAAERAGKGLEQRVTAEARRIAEKYIKPPLTTDFAIMYLPMEGLYAEVLRRPGVIENLQRMHIVLCGPTTLGALLSSLQLGFKTVAIERRSMELWNLLAAFKTEFFRFADLLVKTQKKLSEATDTIESAAKKTRTIQRKLSGVEELSQSDTDTLLGDGF